jgi:hypothetical protein
MKKEGFEKAPAYLLQAQFSFSYPALACFRMGMSGSASFQKAKEFS